MRKMFERRDLKELRPGEKARISPRLAKELIKTCRMPGHGFDVPPKDEDFELVCDIDGLEREFILTDVDGGEKLYIIDGREQVVQRRRPYRGGRRQRY